MNRCINKGWFGLGLLLLVMLLTGLQVNAQEAAFRYSQSVEGVVDGKEVDDSRLDQADVDEHQALEVSGSRTQAAAQRPYAAYALGDDLQIFDAHTVISRDDDDDGYYHRLKVVFDADSSDDEVWVYARLYLSLEGGPWNHYYTTETFAVEGDVSDDAYEVVTRLTDGYPTGYYDVLIELYDEYDDLLAVNYGPYEDGDLAALPLEDSYRDDYDDGYGGGGASGLMMMLLLCMLVLSKGFGGRVWGGIGRVKE
jgi:hypothetical protein